MMKLTQQIQTAIKKKKVIIGYRKSLRALKTGSPKLVVVAQGIPEGMEKALLHNAKISGVEVKKFKGSSRELGVVCGKPFPISTLVIE